MWPSPSSTPNSFQFLTDKKDKKPHIFWKKYWKIFWTSETFFRTIQWHNNSFEIETPIWGIDHWHSNWDWHCIGNLVWDILLRPSITDIQLKHHNRSGEGTRNFCNIFNNGYIQVILPLPIQSEKKQNSIEFLKKFFQRDVNGECQPAININWIEEHFRPPRE